MNEPNLLHTNSSHAALCAEIADLRTRIRELELELHIEKQARSIEKACTCLGAGDECGAKEALKL